MKVFQRLRKAVLCAILCASGAAQAAPFFTYCSVMGASYNPNGTLAGQPGNWVVWANDGQTNRLRACKNATAQLMITTGLEPIRMESGFYDSDGTNKVQIDCYDNYSEIIVGHGVQAIQTAVDRIQAINKTCMTRVLP